MSGCLVGLGYWFFMVAIPVLFRFIRFLLILMIISISSLFVGVGTAIDRISGAWIEQSAGDGIHLGYHPVARSGMKAAAGFLLVIGWLLSIGFILLMVSMIANG